MNYLTFIPEFHGTFYQTIWRNQIPFGVRVRIRINFLSVSFFPIVEPIYCFSPLRELVNFCSSKDYFWKSPVFVIPHLLKTSQCDKAKKIPLLLSHCRSGQFKVYIPRILNKNEKLLNNWYQFFPNVWPRRP